MTPEEQAGEGWHSHRVESIRAMISQVRQGHLAAADVGRHYLIDDLAFLLNLFDQAEARTRDRPAEPCSARPPRTDTGRTGTYLATLDLHVHVHLTTDVD